jgi:large subunit ribosomal protein L15
MLSIFPFPRLSKILKRFSSSPSLLASSSSTFSTSSTSTPITATLSRPPVLPSSLLLSNIRDNEGARKRTRRKGRGVGSGHGLARSAGEGSKGHKSHEGGTTSWGFEGGQAPLWRRTPKIGVAMPRFLRKELETLSLQKLQLWVDTKRINTEEVITMKTLRDSGLVKSIKHGVKLLATGKESFSAKVNVQVSQASEEAIRAIERAGGSITSVYYTSLALRALLKPERFDFPIKSPRPVPKEIGYYLNYRNRGYLSSRLQLERLKSSLSSLPKDVNDNNVKRIQAASQMTVYVGGGPVENTTDDLVLTSQAVQNVATTTTAAKTTAP